MTISEAKFCFVVNVDWFFKSHRLPVAKELLRRGAEVHLVTTRTAASSELEAMGIKVTDMPFSRSGRSPLELAVLVSRLSRLFKSMRPDLVHNVTVKPILVSSLASRIAKVPYVVNAISGFGHLLSETEASPLTRWLATRAYKMALHAPRKSRVIFQNHPALEAFSTAAIVREGDAVLIPGMGVDPAIYRPPQQLPAGPPIVMLVSRMISPKGIEDFAVAAPIIRARCPSARCVLVGPVDEGNPRALSRQQLARLEKVYGLEYWGESNDVASTMRASTIQVFPSYYPEGVPKTLLEAGAIGLPIVASNIPGCREVIRHEDNGLLIEPRAPHELAAAVTQLLADAPLRRRLGESARATVLDRYTQANIVDRHMSMYDGLLNDS